MNNNPELNFFSDKIDDNIISDEKRWKRRIDNYTKENLDDIDIIKAYRKKIENYIKR